MFLALILLALTCSATPIKTGLSVIVTVSLIAVLQSNSHLLKTLLMLEGIGLAIVSTWGVVGLGMAPSSYVLFCLLVFLVSEAALGLGALISHSRMVGSEMMAV